MLPFRKVIVGISGGVDSAVTALLLKRKGFQVHGVFMQNWDIRDETGVCKAEEDFKDAEFVCNILDIPINRVNFVKDYWNYVFSDLLKQYQSGSTPNPDVLCNRFIKFDSFYRFVKKEFNADVIATGHYAATSFGPYLEHFDNNKNVKLFRPKDKIKDQTLFLCQVKQEVLRYTMFPLGTLTKPEVKMIASNNGLEQIANKKESMGICFIGKRDFSDFISEYVENKPGNFINVDSGKIIGQHQGIHHWTLGQRTKIEGLSIAMFTAKKNVATNNIYVAGGRNHPMLYSKTVFTDKPYWIDVQPNELKNGHILECDFKFQHVDKLVSCSVYETNRGLVIKLNEDLYALTSGQFGVLYKNDECLGSAVIRYPGPSNFILNLLNNQRLEEIVNDQSNSEFIAKEAIRL